MTTTADVEDVQVAPDPARDRASTRLRTALVSIIAVAVVVIAGGAGWLAHDSDNGSGAPTPSAVDVGFAQDMITHHTQAVTMAGIERDGTTSKALHALAFDMETSQQLQVGQMFGWLDAWNKPYTSEEPMTWMGHAGHAMVVNGRMPGMATPAQLDKLVNARGKALDILFLQLMIHHHQGGLDMAKYALQHASYGYVRNLAQSMINSQSTEVIQMEQMLRKLGAEPLAPPA